ncbi:MAG: omcB 1 [Cytophagaceae bacterium]|nr:omcB 1 [Cytophagaceae bacterium]
MQNTGIGPAQVGGVTLAERNYSSCNGAFGIVLRVANNSVIEGNWLGVDAATGLLDYGNYDAAITVTGTADVRVGGSVAGSGNICSASGNPGGGADGISIWSTSPRPIIKGNIIGLGADGVTPLQNYGHGIECLTCDDGIIGGPTVLERNLVANSFLIGMQLVNSQRITVINNYVGTDISGTLDRGGAQMGIHISGTSDAMIGGSLAHANIIAYNNASAGVVVTNDSQRNTITFNSIFCNSGPGIDLAGAAANEGVLTPGITSSGANSVNGTGTNGQVIHVYRNTTADGGVKCNCEGEIYIGTTTVSGGVWTVTHNLGLSVADAATVTATQTTPLGSTSEFSTCSAVPLPVELVAFDVLKTTEYSVYISWFTASEKNNDHFNVQRSYDGINFQTIAVVQGSSTTKEKKYYSATDDELAGSDIVYYRLMQVDHDGTSAFSKIKTINLNDTPLVILPEADGFSIYFSGSDEEQLYYEVYAMNGTLVAKSVMEEHIGSDFNHLRLKLSRAHAVYIVNARLGQKSLQKKISVLE